MKILLINAGENNFHRIARNYPLGLMYLASYLREQRGGKDFIKILNLRLRNIKFTHIPNLALKKNRGIHINPVERIENLDELPFSAWDLVNIDDYAKEYGGSFHLGKRKYAAIITSRGCPYHCTYCHNIHGKKIRKRSPENVFKELQFLINQYSIKDFEILYDIFNGDLKHASEVLDLIIMNNLSITLSFPNGLRGDRLPSKFIYKLKKAGTVSVSSFISYSEAMQKESKYFTHFRCSKLDEKNRILVIGFFMTGFPTQTDEELILTIEIAAILNLDIAYFFILSPFKGTEIYNLAVGHNMVFTDIIQYDYNVITRSYKDLKRLQKFYRKAYIKSYLKNLRFLFTFVKLPNKLDLISFLFVLFYVLYFYPFFNKISHIIVGLFHFIIGFKKFTDRNQISKVNYHI